MLLFEKYCAQTSLQQIIIFLVFFSLAQYAKKNGLLRNKGIRAAIGVSVAAVLLIAVFIVYWLIMRKKKGMQSFPPFCLATSFSHVSLPVNKCHYTFFLISKVSGCSSFCPSHLKKKISKVS